MPAKAGIQSNLLTGLLLLSRSDEERIANKCGQPMFFLAFGRVFCNALEIYYDISVYCAAKTRLHRLLLNKYNVMIVLFLSLRRIDMMHFSDKRQER
ncbi:MAG: hypothetical protein EAZ52_04065 [Alphaproteobacteria bacterium]|nr:MAG: hypothetical protein EAZ66_06605 [Alphaproteobacteria bacterium]TAF76525.1 MAG: hypothetical protein EAZ52_04065 [Alphaproteobacteria bacterium]